MAKGHRSQIKRERNANKDTRPSAKLSYARVSVQKACFVLDAIRGKDVQTALGILTYNPRYASSLIKKLLESAIANAENNNGMNAENLYIAEAYANGIAYSDADARDYVASVANKDLLEKTFVDYFLSRHEYVKDFYHQKDILDQAEKRIPECMISVNVSNSSEIERQILNNEVDLGIVEGITEWLPVSSTGHLILVGDLLKPSMSDAFMEMFNVVIQLGAIMAVVVIYFHKLNPFSPKKTEKQKLLTWQMWIKVLIASVPAGIVGILFDDILDKLFYKSVPIAVMLIVYGVLFIVVENRNKHTRPSVTKISELSIQMLLIIGVFQMLALIPGTSRSGATIVGALLIGVSREVAAEFTFFLAIPAMFGASFLKLIKFGFHFTGAEFGLLILGCVVSFGLSVIAIKFLMGYIKKHDFKVFGYYRIVLGGLILATSLITKVIA